MIRPMPKDIAIELDPHRYIVSKTDPRGVIEYGNDYFMEVTGYSEMELIGKPHNIIRHPDMPKVVFKMMWDRISKGKNIMAVVKNLAKDGRYYWVVTEFEPKYDPITNDIISHTAFRKAAPRRAIEAVIPIYKKLVELEKQGGMEASERFLHSFFLEHNTNYDDFIANLTQEKGLLKNLFGSIKGVFK